MPAPSVLTREAIFAIARGLPPGPRTFAALEGRLRDEQTPLEELATVIKRDGALAAHLLRISNSPLYGGAERTGVIEEAVARIGYREIYRLVAFIAGAQLVERPLVHYGLEPELVRENMLRTAFMCERIAEACGLDGRVAYTAGLMRLIGLFVCDRIADNYTPVTPYQSDHDADFTAWEGRLFGLGSDEVAAMVLTEWSFPTEIVAAVRDQYLRRRDEWDNRYAVVLNLAAAMVAAAGVDLGGEGRHWRDGAAKLQHLGIDRAALQRLIATSQEAFEDFSRRVSDPAASEAPERAPACAEPGSAAPTGTGTKGDPPIAKTPDPPVACNFASASGVLETEHDSPVHTEPAGAMTPVDFTTFMSNYQDMVYTTAVRLLGNESQAEDISQEVFLKAYERFDDLSTSPTAGGWLKTVTTNLSINHLQRYRKRWSFFSELVRRDDDGEEGEPVEFASPDGDFLGGLNQADRRAWVERALEKLPEHQRVPLVLYHFEDLPYDEIARRLRVSLAKVKTDILRGRAALAQILARSGTLHEPSML